MIREHENPEALKAGFLALLVHVLFFLLLVMGFNWRSEMPLQVSDVELWDSLPAPAKAPPLPEPPKLAPRVEPKPEAEPPPPEPKAKIVLKEKKKPEPKPKPEKKEPPKPDPAVEKKKEELRKKAEEEKRQKEALRKLQQMPDELAQESQNEELKQLEAARNAERARQAAAAASGVVQEYIRKIQSKIHGRMNRQPCGEAAVEYSISVLPTGEVAGTPRLVKSSGIAACDDAALRAIMQAQPLPLPPDPELFAKFRDITIPFKPGQ